MSALRDEKVNYPHIASAIEEAYCPRNPHIGHEAPQGPVKLEGDVENVYERIKKEPPKKGKGVRDFSESDLESETKEIEMEFATLVTNVLLDMESQGISPGHIAQHFKHIHGLESVYAEADTPLLNQRV